MRYTLSNHQFSAQVSSLGAELKSLTLGREEYIWQGDVDIWSGSAPILFPIVGRLKNGEYQYKNKRYQLDKHGFARHATFELETHSASHLTLSLSANAQTRLHYPFEFKLVVGFTLQATGLTVRYEVYNLGKETMYFTLGSHPALRLDLDHSSLADYQIEFDQYESLDCYQLKDNLLSENPIKAYLKHEKVIPITAHLFNDDALIFKNIQSEKIHLNHLKTGHRLTMDKGNTPHFGLWAKPNAAFVCFEPWYSYDDTPTTEGDLLTKPGIMSLASQSRFTSSYQLLVSANQ